MPDVAQYTVLLHFLQATVARLLGVDQGDVDALHLGVLEARNSLLMFLGADGDEHQLPYLTLIWSRDEKLAAIEQIKEQLRLDYVGGYDYGSSCYRDTGWPFDASVMSNWPKRIGVPVDIICNNAAAAEVELVAEIKGDWQVIRPGQRVGRFHYATVELAEAARKRLRDVGNRWEEEAGLNPFAANYAPEHVDPAAPLIMGTDITRPKRVHPHLDPNLVCAPDGYNAHELSIIERTPGHGCGACCESLNRCRECAFPREWLNRPEDEWPFPQYCYPDMETDHFETRDGCQCSKCRSVRTGTNEVRQEVANG